MAITKARMLQRGGTYGNFDKTKVLPREFQFVESGDPTTYDGRAIYAGFEAGEPKRLSTYEDMSRDLAGALAEIEEEYLGSITTATQNALSATSQASNAASAANSAAEEANNIIDAFKEAVDGTVISDSQSSGAMTYSSQKIESDFLRKNGNGSNVTVNFQQAAQRAGIQSGDSLATAFGKLAKFCADLQDYVFNPPIANLTSTDDTRPLAASMGKALKDEIGDLNDLPTTDKSSLVAAIAEQNSSLIGYGTPNANCIDTSQETECRYIKIGHICHVSLVFTPSVTFGAEYTLFSGIPEAESYQEFPYVVERTDGLVKVGQFRVVGQTILNWYGDSPKIGTPVKTGITYITK